MFYEVAHAVLRPISHAVWRPTVTGTENVPKSGAVILASNHLSFIDSFVIPLVAPRKVHFLAKQEYWTGEGLSGHASRWFFTEIGAVAVDRDSPRAAQESLNAGLKVLQRGGAFGLYPEGTRSRDGRLYRGHPGVAWLALTAGCPIVPVGLTGTQDIQPVGSNVPRLAKVSVTFGEPIQVTDEVKAMPAGKARRLLTDQVMESIAALVPGQPRADEYNERSAQA